jgi:hypothetical protein
MINLNDPLIISAASVISGFGISYLFFDRLIRKKYGGGAENPNRTFYWLGFVGMITSGQGLSRIFNELYASAIRGTAIQGDPIFRGAITIIFFAIVLLGVAFIYSKFSRGKSTKAEAEANSSSKSRKLGGLIFIGILSLAAVLFYNSQSLHDSKKNLSSATDGEYHLYDCETCNNGICKTDEKSSLVKFYFKNGMVNYTVLSNGSEAVVNVSTVHAVCSFLGDKSYSCVTKSNYPGLFNQEFKNSFDGNGAWHWYQMLQDKNGVRVTSTKCKVR